METYFFTGKGGTGKTTISSALAWELAEKEQDTLLVSLDPAHNLQDIFELEKSVTSHRINEYLTIQEPDFDSIKQDYLQEKIRFLRETTSHLSAFNVENYLETLQYSPGQEEYAITLYLRQLLFNDRDSDYKFIVFDTPPTGILLKILSLPKISSRWLTELIKLRTKIVDRKEMIGNIRGEEAKAEYYNKDQVLKKLHQQKEEYEQLRQFYKEAHLYTITNPDILVEKESQRLIQKLKEIGIKVEGIINNKCDSNYKFKHLNIEDYRNIKIGETKEKSKKYQLNQNLIQNLNIEISK